MQVDASGRKGGAQAAGGAHLGAGWAGAGMGAGEGLTSPFMRPGGGDIWQSLRTTLDRCRDLVAPPPAGSKVQGAPPSRESHLQGTGRVRRSSRTHKCVCSPQTPAPSPPPSGPPCRPSPHRTRRQNLPLLCLLSFLRLAFLHRKVPPSPLILRRVPPHACTPSLQAATHLSKCPVENTQACTGKSAS